MRCSIYFLIFICLGISGCATQPLSYEEIEARDWRRGIDRENWEMCMAAYKQADRYTVHVNHEGTPQHHRRINNIRSDLLVNQCRWVMRNYWIDY